MTTFEIRRCDICGAVTDRRGLPARMLDAEGWRRCGGRDICPNCNWDMATDTLPGDEHQRAA